MSQPTPTDELAARVRTMQLILGAMILGAAAFLVIVFVQRQQTEQPIPDPPWLSYGALTIAVVLAVAYYFVTDWVAAGQRRKIARGASNSPGVWCAAYQNALLAGAAVLEAAAFVLILVYFVEGHWPKNWVPLLTATGFIAFMVSLLPSRSGIESWIKEQQEKLKAEQGGRQ